MAYLDIWVDHGWMSESNVTFTEVNIMHENQHSNMVESTYGTG